MTAAIIHDEHAPVRKRPVIAWLVAMWIVLVVVYLVLHWALPPSDEGLFFWNEVPAQWLDWLFWSTTGAFLFLLSMLASRSVDPKRDSISLPTTAWDYTIEVVTGLAVALIVLWVATRVLDVDWLGLKIRLKEAPSVAAALAFVLGFYPRVARRLFFRVVSQFLRRVAERALGRTIGGKADDTTYLELHVDPRLQRAYLMAASVEPGKSGHEASRRKRVGYKVSKIVHKSGFTVNALRTVFIADDLMSSEKDDFIVELVAHEASHVDQAMWSDSLQQEADAYQTGARVMKELKKDCKVKRGDVHGWLDLGPEQAKDKVREWKSVAPLYGMIPREQKTGRDDKKEAVRQVLCLVLDMLGLGRWCTRED